MATDQRQCPRCKTWNEWSRSNCSHCGAVMLGVAAIDIDAMARGDRGPLHGSKPAAHDHDQLRQTMDALQQARAARQAAGATPAGNGCAGCLGKLLLIVAIVVGGATIVAIDSPDSKPGRTLRKLWHEIERDVRVEMRRKASRSSVPPPPQRPRPVPTAPDPWNVPAQPPPDPLVGNAPLVAPDPDAPQPLTDRAKMVASALDRRWSQLLRCVQPLARPGEPRKLTARVALRVHVESSGAVDFEAVVEPGDSQPGALRCLRAAARGLVVVNGEPVTFVYHWPKGPER